MVAWQITGWTNLVLLYHILTELDVFVSRFWSTQKSSFLKFCPSIIFSLAHIYSIIVNLEMVTRTRCYVLKHIKCCVTEYNLSLDDKFSEVVKLGLQKIKGWKFKWAKNIQLFWIPFSLQATEIMYFSSCTGCVRVNVVFQQDCSAYVDLYIDSN